MNPTNKYCRVLRISERSGLDGKVFEMGFDCWMRGLQRSGVDGLVRGRDGVFLGWSRG